jgi:hypothetical protein
MSRTVEDIEEAITQLPQNQLRKFRSWYEKYDAQAWDEQIERDSAEGKFDTLAEAAIADHEAGKSRKISQVSITQEKSKAPVSSS